MAKPLIFSEIFKESILTGKKTVTRRPIKHSCVQSAVNNNHWYWEKTVPATTSIPIPGTDCRWIVQRGTMITIETTTNHLINECPWGDVDDVIELATINERGTAEPFARAIIKNIDIDPLNRITRAQAIAEGMPDIDPINYFAQHWNEIYGNTHHRWVNNPAVWVMTFEVLPASPEATS
ncbi:ASCH domain-containing protein [Edwardsiella tarda]|uniref:ASCH domain-containing protein n=1 Tax=Edwardsiella tarda TaxID=636 RepID=UPI002444CBAA|nr:ASCH domain-containing protein [Edwardsiella tarda]WGE29437.1 ASCH domain-containing protein [Edwardsiella tarda]